MNSGEEFKLQERFALYMWEFPEIVDLQKYSYIHNSTEGSRKQNDLVIVNVTCSLKRGHRPDCGKPCT
jgi:hypothetical protein